MRRSATPSEETRSFWKSSTACRVSCRGVAPVFGMPRRSLTPYSAPRSLLFFQAEDGIRYSKVTGVQTCALPISVICYAGRASGTGRRDLFSPRSGTRRATVAVLQHHGGDVFPTPGRNHYEARGAGPPRGAPDPSAGAVPPGGHARPRAPGSRGRAGDG